MRAAVVTLALGLAVGCAGGGMGSSSTSIGVSSTAGTTGETTTTDGGETTLGAIDTGTDDGSGTAGTSSGADESTAGSSETGEVLPCEAALETFAADPGWTAVELPHDGNVFGWVGTQLAGGAPGEIGGTLQRTGTALYYADTSIAMAAGDCVTGSGLLAATMRESNFNTGVSLGHFGTAGGTRIGMHLAESNDGMLRVFMVAGDFSEQLFLMEATPVSREWSYAYDPVEATMSLSIDGLGGVTRPVDPAALAGLEGIDAFGISVGPSDNPGDATGLLGLYLDEITYTR